MRLGLLGARADQRGLGRLTSEAYRALRPSRTLVIDMGPGGFPQDFTQYPDGQVLPFARGQLDRTVLRDFLRGLDVCYVAETPYDYAAYDIAREVGCRLKLHAMPEFYRHGLEPNLPRPDAVWAATSWRLSTLPAGTPVIPVPVALDRFPGKPARRDPGEPLRVLHVAGKAAAQDRNGTRAFLAALPLIRQPVVVTVISQDRAITRLPRVPPNVRVNVILGSGLDYPSLYADQHLLVLPRRYGGLSLPAQEAMAAGLAVVMPDVSPNTDWPIIPVPARVYGQLWSQGGLVPVHDVRAEVLAGMIGLLAADDRPRMLAAERAVDWAHAHSWDALRPLYLRELARA